VIAHSSEIGKWLQFGNNFLRLVIDDVILVSLGGRQATVLGVILAQG
jgi:hypothetical protein